MGQTRADVLELVLFHDNTGIWDCAETFALARTTALVTRIIRPAYSASSLHNFFFNAFDPARVLARGALWVQVGA
jgi:hypothetical protein